MHRYVFLPWLQQFDHNWWVWDETMNDDDDDCHDEEDI